MSNPVVPLRVANDVEPTKSWQGYATPHDLAMYMARMLSVDATKLLQLQELLFSDTEPQGTDRGRIWIKQSEPSAIGIPIGDVYTMIYKYPPNVPILWMQGETAIPSYFRNMTGAEMSDCGLATPTNPNYFWVIFNV